MKKFILSVISTITLFSACESIFPDALSSPEKIKGFSVLKNIDNTLSSPVIEGKFICQLSSDISKVLCKNQEYNVSLPNTPFLQSTSNDTIYADSDMEINMPDVGDVIITKPNVTITFKAPYTQNSLTNIQKIKSITDNTGSAKIIFKGGDYYIESININDDNKKPSFKVKNTSFTIQTPNNSRLFIKTFEAINNKPIPLNISLNEENNPNALLIYSFDNFNIDIKGKVKGNFYLYGYEDISLKANPNSLIKGAIHSDKELSDYRVRVEYVKPEGMYKLIVCNTLPPIPDSKKNNETLLGIDSNNNGIRDDVEIKILSYKPEICKYRPQLKECNLSQNPAFIAVAFQYARAFQKILREFDGSKESAYKVDKETDPASYCYFYFRNNYNDLRHVPLMGFIEKFTYNTKTRKKFYYKFNEQLSGGVFELPRSSTYKNYCEFNVTQIEGEIKKRKNNKLSN